MGSDTCPWCTLVLSWATCCRHTDVVYVLPLNILFLLTEVKCQMSSLSDDGLVWLSVWSGVQSACSWCHCIPKPHHLLRHLNSCQFYHSVQWQWRCKQLFGNPGYVPWLHSTATYCDDSSMVDRKTVASRAGLFVQMSALDFDQEVKILKCDYDM